MIRDDTFEISHFSRMADNNQTPVQTNRTRGEKNSLRPPTRKSIYLKAPQQHLLPEVYRYEYIIFFKKVHISCPFSNTSKSISSSTASR